MAMTLCTRACTFIRFSFSPANSDITPVAVVNAPDRPFTPDIKPCRFASSLARILVCRFTSASVSERCDASAAILRYSSVFCSPFMRMRVIVFCKSRSCIAKRRLLSLFFSCSAVSSVRAPFSSSRTFFAALSSARAAPCALPGASFSYAFCKAFTSSSTCLTIVFCSLILSLRLLFCAAACSSDKASLRYSCSSWETPCLACWCSFSSC